MGNTMKVILKQPVKGLGAPGDVVQVAGGYGRNYLIPRGLAVEATPHQMRLLEQERRALERRMQKSLEEARALAERLNQASITLIRQAGEEDRMFGSVSNRDIAEALGKEGFSIDRRQILLGDPIRKLGLYEVPIRLHPEVVATVKVWVVKAG